MATTGSLSYDFSNKNFLVNRTGTDDGWVSLPISPSAENITQEDLKTWANKLGGQNQSRLYVDIGNPLASDSKDNRGNSQLRPFRSIERALAEVARISFKKNPAGNSTPNDAFERITVSIAPGEYEVQNGPRSKLGVFDNYGRYQDAVFSIGENKDSIVNASFAAITDQSYRISTYEQDLDYFLNAIIKDLSTGGNVYTLRVAQTLVTSDESVGYDGPNDPQPGYFVTRYSGTAADARAQMVTALNTLALQVKEADSENPSNQDVVDSIDKLVNHLINTFICQEDPRDATLIKYGAYSAGEFPVSEPSKADLQRFNSIDNAGIILPRGVSIVGEDLRKVVIRPTYVPDPTDSLAGRGAIFRMTGGNFFSGFTIKDQKLKNTANPSHHKLTAFEFCSEEDLESYYTDIDIAFSDPNVYNRALDAANLLEKNEKWIAENFDFPNNDYGLVFESESEQLIIAIQKDLRGITNKNVIEFGKKFHNAHIAPLEVSTQASARDAYHNLLDDLYSDLVRAISNLGGVVDLEVIDSGTESEVFDGVRAEPFVGRCADIQAVLYTYIEAVKALITDPTASIAEGLSRQAFAFVPSDIEVRDPENSIVLGLTAAEEENPPGADKINTVLGASPYIFSASIRSEYGMCGIDGDGSKVTGLKSYLAAQFTIVSLQKDPDAFIADPVEVGGNRYRGSKIADSVDYTHFGYRVTNGAYSQLVSCFCIGPARHYVAESGGEFSITNSTSNFGDVSLYSKGFNTTDLAGKIDNIGAYPQDKNHELVGIIRPKNYDFSTNRLNTSYVSVGTILSYQYSTSNSVPDDQDYYTNSNIDSLYSWKTEPSSWKNWSDEYGRSEEVALSNYDYSDNTEVVPEGKILITSGGTVIKASDSPNYVSTEVAEEEETGRLYTITRPTFSEYSSINYVKITLRGPIRKNITGVKYNQKTYNGEDRLVPDLKFVYAPPSTGVENYVLTPNKAEVTGVSSDPVDSFDVNYNKHLSTERKGLVKDVLERTEGEQIFTDIILDVRNWENYKEDFSEETLVALGINPDTYTADGIKNSSKGEWFERETLIDENRSKLLTQLRGLNLSIKRFFDDRSYEDRRYKFLFKRLDNTKRIPPDNFILRKQTGVVESDITSQPLRFIDASEQNLNRIFYTQNIRQVKDLDLSFYTDNQSIINSLIALNEDPDNTPNGEGPFLFSCEFISSNSDTEGRANTDDDIFENSKFSWEEDAEEISIKSIADQQLLLSVTTTEEYLTKDTTERIISLSQPQQPIEGFDLEVKAGDTLDKNRLSVYSGINDTRTEFAFAKPSIIRAGGQTWEYMGYYNYNTGIPTYQIANLGDKLSGNEKKIFRLEKVQKYVLGGRVYASGMDELGNIIQGNTITDLKTGRVETPQIGTTAPITSGGEESLEGGQEPSQFIRSLSFQTLSATSGGTVDFANANEVILPSDIGGGSVTFSQDNFIFSGNRLTIQSGVLDTKTLLENTETAETEISLEIKDGVTLDLSKLKDIKIDLNKFNTGTSSLPEDSDKYSLAKRSTENDVSLSSLINPNNNVYITPKTLERWRNNLQLVGTAESSSNFYVGYGHVNEFERISITAYPNIEEDPSGLDFRKVPRTYNEWELLDNYLKKPEIGHPGLNFSDPRDPNFVPFDGISSLLEYTKSKGENETVVVICNPGIYPYHGFISHGLKIEPTLIGRYDGRDYIDDPISVIMALNGLDGGWNGLSSNSTTRASQLENIKKFSRWAWSLNRDLTTGEVTPLTDQDLIDLNLKFESINRTELTYVSASGFTYTLQDGIDEVRSWKRILPTVYTNGSYGSYVAGLKSVILTPSNGFRSVSGNYTYEGNTVTGYDAHFDSNIFMNIKGNNNAFTRCIFWGRYDFNQRMCDSVYVCEFMRNNPAYTDYKQLMSATYDENWDIDNNIYGSLIDVAGSATAKTFSVGVGTTNIYSLPFRGVTTVNWGNDKIFWDENEIPLSTQIEGHTISEEVEGTGLKDFNGTTFSLNRKSELRLMNYRRNFPGMRSGCLPLSEIKIGLTISQLERIIQAGRDPLYVNFNHLAETPNASPNIYYTDLGVGSTRSNRYIEISGGTNRSFGFNFCIFGPIGSQSDWIRVANEINLGLYLPQCVLNGNIKTILPYEVNVRNLLGDRYGTTIVNPYRFITTSSYLASDTQKNITEFSHSNSLVHIDSNVEDINLHNIFLRSGISAKKYGNVYNYSHYTLLFTKSQNGNRQYDTELIIKKLIEDGIEATEENIRAYVLTQYYISGGDAIELTLNNITSYTGHYSTLLKGNLNLNSYDEQDLLDLGCRIPNAPIKINGSKNNSFTFSRNATFRSGGTDSLKVGSNNSNLLGKGLFVEIMNRFDKRDTNSFTINSSKSREILDGCIVISSDGTVLGSGTQFTNLAIGSVIIVQDIEYSVLSIESDTEMEVERLDGEQIIQLKEISVTEIIGGISYGIFNVGDTDFTLIGASNNNPGTIFTAQSAGTGSGTLGYSFFIDVKNYNILDLDKGEIYYIDSCNGDMKQFGAPANSISGSHVPSGFPRPRFFICYTNRPKFSGLGTVTLTTDGNITGTGTGFKDRHRVGDSIEIENVDYRILSISSPSSMVVEREDGNPIPAGITVGKTFRYYEVNDVSATIRKYVGHKLSTEDELKRLRKKVLYRIENSGGISGSALTALNGIAAKYDENNNLVQQLDGTKFEYFMIKKDISQSQIDSAASILSSNSVEIGLLAGSARVINPEEVLKEQVPGSIYLRENGERIKINDTAEAKIGEFVPVNFIAERGIAGSLGYLPLSRNLENDYSLNTYYINPFINIISYTSTIDNLNINANHPQEYGSIINHSIYPYDRGNYGLPEGLSFDELESSIQSVFHYIGTMYSALNPESPEQDYPPKISGLSSIHLANSQFSSFGFKLRVYTKGSWGGIIKDSTWPYNPLGYDSGEYYSNQLTNAESYNSYASGDVDNPYGILNQIVDLVPDPKNKNNYNAPWDFDLKSSSLNVTGQSIWF